MEKYTEFARNFPDFPSGASFFPKISLFSLIRGKNSLYNFPEHGKKCRILKKKEIFRVGTWKIEKIPGKIRYFFGIRNENSEILGKKLRIFP